MRAPTAAGRRSLISRVARGRGGIPDLALGMAPRPAGARVRRDLARTAIAGRVALDPAGWGRVPDLQGRVLWSSLSSLRCAPPNFWMNAGKELSGRRVRLVIKDIRGGIPEWHSAYLHSRVSAHVPPAPKRSLIEYEQPLSSARNSRNLPREGIDSDRAEPLTPPCDFFSGQDRECPAGHERWRWSQEATGVFRGEPGTTGGCAGPGNGKRGGLGRTGRTVGWNGDCRLRDQSLARRKRFCPARGSQDGGAGSRCPTHLWSGRASEGNAHRP